MIPLHAGIFSLYLVQQIEKAGFCIESRHAGLLQKSGPKLATDGQNLQPPGLKSGDLHSKRGPAVRKSRARSPLSGGMGSGLKYLSKSQAKSTLSGGIRSNQKLVVRKSRARSPLSGGMGSGLKAALRKSQATSTISGGIRSNQKLCYEEVPSGIGTF